MGLLHDTVTLLGSSGQWDSFKVPPHCWGAVGSGTPSVHCHAVGEQWLVGLLHDIATPLGSGVVRCGVLWRGAVRCGVVHSVLLWCDVVVSRQQDAPVSLRPCQASSKGVSPRLDIPPMGGAGQAFDLPF